MYIRFIKKNEMNCLCFSRCGFAISALVFVGLAIVSCGQEEPTAVVVPDRPQEPMVEVDDEFLGSMRDLTSAELVAEMGVGWNLGNSFDVIDRDKTIWGNPLSSGSIVRAVKARGFETLRIPITWNFHQGPGDPFPIESSYLERIELIVNEALKSDMHVIINTHHDEWIIPTEEESDRVSNRLSSLWTQVSDHFSAYGDKLIFEVMNEPRLRNSPEEWNGGTQEGRDVINGYQQVSVDAIRSTGGNNSKRHLMIPTYAASTHPNAMQDLVVPNEDPNIIISIHSYFPWEFAGLPEGTDMWGSDEEKAALDTELNRIRDKWVTQEGRAVILGEWGTIDKDNISARIEYAMYYTTAAMERGMLPIIWDDGGNFGLFDRHTMTWRFPEIADAVVAAGK